MLHSPQRHVVRRPRLGFDCLEDRFAPAVLDLFSPSAFVAAVDVSSGAPATVAPASVNVDPVREPAFGFFHVFAQNGFCGGELIENAPAPPRPRPVTPPPLPTGFEQTPATSAEIVPASTEAPAPAPQTAPLPVLLPPLLPVPAAPVAPQLKLEVPPRPIEHIEQVFEQVDDITAPAASESYAAAAISGLFAASYLASRNTRERRADDFIAWGV